MTWLFVHFKLPRRQEIDSDPGDGIWVCILCRSPEKHIADQFQRPSQAVSLNYEAQRSETETDSQSIPHDPSCGGRECVERGAGERGGMRM